MNAGTTVRVAIDGPAGAGKSTVARRVAERLGFVLVDTGAMYRAIALAAKRAGVAWDDEPDVSELARSLVASGAVVLERGRAGGVQVLLSGEDVSLAIREPDMGFGASRISAIPAVRAALLDAQRAAGARLSVVMEGRDIGTVVLPDAEVKFFLTASDAVRARRRYEELVARGSAVTYEGTLHEVRLRDKADTERAVAPLRQAADAILVDSSDRPIDDVVDEMVRIVEERTGRR